MNILVTGATGFLGSRIVEHLLGEDKINHIIATGRKISVDAQISHQKLHYILGDLRDKYFINSLFEKSIDIVINCASLSSPWGAQKAFYEANVTTQKHLIEASEISFVKRFIYISSPSIYFNFKNAIGINENSPIPKRMVNQYAKTKWIAENLLRESKLSHVILRPRALIGRGDTVIMPRLIRASMEGKLKIMGSGENIVDLTPVSNMAEAVRLSIFTKNFNETYNISNGEPINLWESINYILTAIGLPSINSKIPYPILYTAAILMEYKSKLFSNKEPALTQYSVGILAKSFTFDIQKARNKLNFQPKQTTSQAMEEFIQWYKEKNNDNG